MPRGSPSFPVLSDLRSVMQSSNLSPSQAARIMNLERTLIWRAYKGKPITQTNADVIAQRLHLLSGKVPPVLSYEYATDLLRLLLMAVEKYSIDHPPGTGLTRDK